MLNFSKEYGMAETREDFLVDATMKTVWMAELEVLNEIARVCEKYGLTWYMAFGSLLGAVRHQGFVPWDDDMDICLKRKDYMQLLAVLPQELPEGYMVKSPLLENWYPEYHSCVVNSNCISIEPEHLKKFHGCPFIVGIDIFPLDYLEEEDKSIKVPLFQTARQGAIKVKNREINKELLEILSLLEKQCDVTIDRRGLEKGASEEERDELAAGLWGLANEIVMWDNKAETDKLAMYLDYVKYHKFYEAKWFEDVKWLSFEGFQVPVPREYDKILRATYGDYTVKIRHTAVHDYPFYKKQLEQLRKHVAEVEAARERKE
jgi:lipopolysaccharide cholinephosphotransferase